MREWLRSLPGEGKPLPEPLRPRALPWRRIFFLALAGGFIWLEVGSIWHMGRRSVWTLLAVLSLLGAAEEGSIWRAGTSGVRNAWARARLSAEERRKRAKGSQGVVARAREKRLARWRRGG